MKMTEMFTGIKNLAPRTKAKIGNLLNVLYNDAIRWGFVEFSPISGPVKDCGVRQSTKRKKVPHIRPYNLVAPDATAWLQIIGMIAAKRNDGLSNPILPEDFVPYRLLTSL
jgi:hypothetical protein